jgi:hypothetical protein
MEIRLFQFIIMIVGLTFIISLGIVPAQFNHYAIAQQCDQSLWNHVYHEDRLSINDICMTVSGTIVNRTPEPDGDIHLRVKLDPQFTNLLTPSNYAHQHGYLVVEPMCQRSPTYPPAIPFCNNYRQNIIIPSDGTHVTITGSYVLDEEHEGWAEIHPVSSIVPSSAENITSRSEGNNNNTAVIGPSP